MHRQTSQHWTEVVLGFTRSAEPCGLDREQSQRPNFETQHKAQTPRHWKLKTSPMAFRCHQSTATRMRTAGFSKTVVSRTARGLAGGALVVVCLFISDRSDSTPRFAVLESWWLKCLLTYPTLACAPTLPSCQRSGCLRWPQTAPMLNLLRHQRC